MNSRLNIFTVQVVDGQLIESDGARALEGEGPFESTNEEGEEGEERKGEVRIIII